MADTEKITINLSAVDLGHIDLLVEQSFYSTRTDFIRTAIRNQIQAHSHEISETVARKAVVVGVLAFDKGDLEEYVYKNQRVDIRALGMLVLTKDVTPELARSAIGSIKVFGVFRAEKAVKEALADRML
jgi:metal-responsive CopG/Arc/MetJ family transcriptional regulator